MDKVFESFLRRQFDDGMALAAESDLFDLVPLDRWVIGGHEIRETTFEAAAQELHRESDILDSGLIEKCRPMSRRKSR